MLVTRFFDRALGHEHAPCDGDVREPFGHQFEHLSFAHGELCERVVTAAPSGGALCVAEGVSGLEDAR